MQVILYRDSAGEYGWVTISHGIKSEWRKEPGFKEIGTFNSEKEAREYCRQHNLPVNQYQ